MATLTGSASAASLSVSPADPTVGFRRMSAAIALPLGFAFQLACNTIYAIVSTESGLSDTGAASETLAFYARYPEAFSAASILAMFGVLAIVAGLPAALRVLRPVRPRLALWAVALMVGGYVSYFGIVATNFSTLALASSTGGAADPRAVAVLEASASPLLLPFFLLFVIGNLVGTLLLGLAALLGGRRAGGTAPRWAGALIIGWPVGHALNVFAGLGEWFAVAGGALEVAGLTALAVVAIRTTNASWASRG